MAFFLLILIVGVIVIAVLNGFIAPLKIHFRTDPAALPIAPSKGDEQAQPFVGLALSGGGARAAVFGAAGMKALHASGLLTPVTHVSSVSGGGFPASYFALHPMPAEGTGDAYFEQMLDVIAHDYFWDTQMQQLRKPRRAFSPSRRLVSLQDALERPDFLGTATFADLPQDRTFFFNSVSYDTAQRVPLSNGALPAPEDANSASVLPKRLRSLTFSDAVNLRAAPSDFPVSLAVASSAAFPPYLGPNTIEVLQANGEAAQYWHLGDGGVFENLGLETLREAVFAQGPNQNATIYAFNAGMQIDSQLSKNTLDISIWSRDVTRLVDVLSEYATSHRESMFDALDKTHGMNIDVIEFNYMDIARLVKSGNAPHPRWLSWEGWTHATAADRAQSETPADHLAKIPTALKISAGHRELIAMAAEDLVSLHFSSTSR
ncbi:patatin-like phospholipase family protein [Planktotalea sp.]|uniref:patatin-like phospholipase family protein n=1 Tax=Planktotalea sp. TaxID=2029877 RepID=UPI0032998B1E